MDLTFLAHNNYTDTITIIVFTKMNLESIARNLLPSAGKKQKLEVRKNSIEYIGACSQERE